MLDGRGAVEAAFPVGDAPLPSARASRKPVLVVLHQAHSNPGHVGQWFQRHGYRLDIRRHFDGQPLPATLRDHCGAVIFGGPQSANDRIDFIRREVEWVGVALKEKAPFLGICLGAQMLAHHLGAKVDHCPHGHVEIGYHRIKTTEMGRQCGGFPEQVFQWHREGFELPRGAELLAAGLGAYPNQAFRFGEAAYGVQFHPEITFAQVNRWSGGNPIRLLQRGAQPRQHQIESHLMLAGYVHRWLDRFLTQWVARDLANR